MSLAWFADSGSAGESRIRRNNHFFLFLSIIPSGSKPLEDCQDDPLVIDIAYFKSSKSTSPALFQTKATHHHHGY